MKAVIQRVCSARVAVNDQIVGEIGGGLLVFLAVTNTDELPQAEKMADKTAKLRIFRDENKKMNLSVLDLQKAKQDCGILVISNFTLCGNVKGMNRPEFMSAAKPEQARVLYQAYLDHLKNRYDFRVETGIFQAEMAVSLVNDGPVTLVLDTEQF